MAGLSWGQKSNGRCFSYNTDVVHGTISISGLVLGMDGIVNRARASIEQIMVLL